MGEVSLYGRADTFAEATRVGHETRKELNKMWKLLEVGHCDHFDQYDHYAHFDHCDHATSTRCGASSRSTTLP